MNLYESDMFELLMMCWLTMAMVLLLLRVKRTHTWNVHITLATNVKMIKSAKLILETFALTSCVVATQLFMSVLAGVQNPLFSSFTFFQLITEIHNFASMF